MREVTPWPRRHAAIITNAGYLIWCVSLFGVNQIITITNQFQVFPYTECGMGMESQEYTKSVLQPKLFVEKTCTQVRHGGDGGT